LSISVSAWNDTFGQSDCRPPAAAALRGKKISADLRCFTGSAKRPRHRPRVRRQQAFCWIAAGAARHSSTHDEDGKEIRVTIRKMLKDDDED